MITIFGADAYRVFLNNVTFAYLLALPIYVIIGAIYTYYLLGPWCFVAIGIFVFCYIIQVSYINYNYWIIISKKISTHKVILLYFKLHQISIWQARLTSVVAYLRVKTLKFTDKRVSGKYGVISSNLYLFKVVHPKLSYFISNRLQVWLFKSECDIKRLYQIFTFGIFKKNLNSNKFNTSWKSMGKIHFLNMLISSNHFLKNIVVKSCKSFAFLLNFFRTL